MIQIYFKTKIGFVPVNYKEKATVICHIFSMHGKYVSIYEDVYMLQCGYPMCSGKVSVLYFAPPPTSSTAGKLAAALPNIGAREFGGR